MKKSLLIFLLLTLSLTLAACGGNTASTASPDTGFQADPNVRELPLSSKLAIGTLKLEATEYAVASDQATELLPLWQVLNSLSSSDTAAPEELTAITEQIQETMTAEQLQAIEEMGLTQEDMFATMQELGLVNAPQANVEGTPQPGAGFGGGQGQGPPDGGFVPGGAPPGGGPGGGEGPGGGFGGQGLTQEQIATAQARRAEGGGAGFGNRMAAPLVEAVIKLLESKADS
jgi:predicted small secreted protein